MNPDEVIGQRASGLQAWMRDSREFFLPPSMRERYEAQARFYTEQPPTFWNVRRDAREAELQAVLKELRNWMDETDAELLLRKMDDELFFWYVLKIQFVWLYVISRDPQEWVFGEMDLMWSKYFLIQPKEGWGYWTVVAAQYTQKCGEYPPWGFCMPREMSGGQGFPALLHQDRK
jgi:hypothetical protein